MYKPTEILKVHCFDFKLHVFLRDDLVCPCLEEHSLNYKLEVHNCTDPMYWHLRYGIEALLPTTLLFSGKPSSRAVKKMSFKLNLQPARYSTFL